MYLGRLQPVRKRSDSRLPMILTAANVRGDGMQFASEHLGVCQSTIVKGCAVCQGLGRCLTCKGRSFSGYFLNTPSKPAPPCWRCAGTGNCRSCGGTGSFSTDPRQSYIHVVSSRVSPTSISMAAVTGASWRRIALPSAIRQRPFKAQRGWVSWRIRMHYKKESGVCPLFGTIIGYCWVLTPEVKMRFDTDGRLLAEPSGSRGRAFVISDM